MGISQLQLAEGWLTVSMDQLPAYGKISDQGFELNGGTSHLLPRQAEGESDRKSMEDREGLLERISRRYRTHSSTGSTNWK